MMTKTKKVTTTMKREVRAARPEGAPSELTRAVLRDPTEERPEVGEGEIGPQAVPLSQNLTRLPPRRQLQVPELPSPTRTNTPQHSPTLPSHLAAQGQRLPHQQLPPSLPENRRLSISKRIRERLRKITRSTLLLLHLQHPSHQHQMSGTDLLHPLATGHDQLVPKSPLALGSRRRQV